MKNFTAASGITAYPISRHSATHHHSLTTSFWNFWRYSRTSGMVAHTDACRDASLVRMYFSSPSHLWQISPSSFRESSRSSSQEGTKYSGFLSSIRNTCQTARYIAQVSRYFMSNLSAKARAVDHLPLPATPSIAMFIFLFFKGKKEKLKGKSYCNSGWQERFAWYNPRWLYDNLKFIIYNLTFLCAFDFDVNPRVR